MKKQFFVLMALTLPLLGSQNDQITYDSVKNRLEARMDYIDLTLRANKLIKGAFLKPKFDYFDTENALETADRMRKEAIVHYEKALIHLNSLPPFDIRHILEESIKESAKTITSNPRERLIKYVTVMVIEIMSKYGVDAIASLTNFSYEVIHATTLIESAEELTKIAPSLSGFYSAEDHHLLIKATMSLINIDLYTYAFIDPKDGIAVSNFFKSVRDDFFDQLRRYKKIRHCICYDMLYKIKNFNLMCLCLENTPPPFTANIIDLALKGAEDLFYLEQNTSIKHYEIYEDGEKEDVYDFWEIEWRAY